MKNFFSLVGAFALTIPLAAQLPQRMANVSEANSALTLPAFGANNEQSSEARTGSRAANDTISGYYWNFADSIPMGWTVMNVTGNAQWIWSNLGPQGSLSTGTAMINSTSKANGFMILDGDLNNTATPPTYKIQDSYFQTPALDFSGSADVVLKFQSSSRYCCNPTTISMVVQVSNNGTEWYDYDFREELPVNILSANPTYHTINISQYAANQPSVYVRFHVSGASHYFWMIDDVAFTEPQENDLILRQVFVDYGYEGGGKYTRLPKLQVPALTFRGIVENQGSVNQTNVSLDVKVTKSGTTQFEGSGILPQIPRASFDTLRTTTPYIPTETGSYSVSFNLTQDQTDANPLDNIGPASTFLVTDTVFARDNNTPSSGKRISVGNYAGGTVDGSRIGNIFECPNTGKITSMSIFLATDQKAIGTSFKGFVYQISDAGFTLLLETDFYDITMASQMNKWVTVPFMTDGISEFIPEGGADYLVGFEVYGVSEDHNVYVAEDQITKQPSRTTYVFLGDTWYFVNNLPYIRLNVGDLDASVKDLKSNPVLLGQNMPNPANTYSLVDYMLENSSAVTLDITDISGKLIRTVSEGKVSPGKHQITINTSELSAGTYFYTLKTNSGSQTKRMMIVR